MLVDHRAIDGAEHDGEVETPVNHPCDVISRGPVFLSHSQWTCLKLVVRGGIPCLKSM